MLVVAEVTGSIWLSVRRSWSEVYLARVGGVGQCQGEPYRDPPRHDFSYLGPR